MIRFLFILVLSFVHVQFCSAQLEQVEQTSIFFAQGMFPEKDVESIKSLESEIRALPFVRLARLGVASNCFFILTKDIEELDEEKLRSWFSELGGELTCIQIGVYGVDHIKPSPFEDCKK